MCKQRITYRTDPGLIRMDTQVLSKDCVSTVFVTEHLVEIYFVFVDYTLLIVWCVYVGNSKS